MESSGLNNFNKTPEVKISGGFFRILRRHIKKSILCALLLFPLLLFFTANLIFPLPHPYQDKNFAQVVLDADGKPLRYFADANGDLRYRVSLEEVSPYYIEALIGYEDRYFRYHPGINPISMGRAFYQWIKNGRIISGGSTITMQVARIIDPHQRTVSGKLKQMFRALQLELYYTKDEILEFYLNLAPFGGNVYGAQTASHIYFDRDISKITRNEAAVLAVLPQAPSRLRPDRYPQAATAAKNKLALRMLEYGYWDKDDVDIILHDDVYCYPNPLPMISPLLAERLARVHFLEPAIKTYIDRPLQLFIEELLARNIYFMPDGVSAAVIVVDNSSHTVVAYAGSIEYGNMERFGYVDMVRATRSPGSALKPFAYALALDKGLIHSHSLLLDTPRYFSHYQAGNFYDVFHGPVTAKDALQKSLNVPAVQIVEHLTPEYFYTSLLGTGINLPVLGGKPNLSIILGGTGIRLDDLALLYSSIGNGGNTDLLRFSELDSGGLPRVLMSEESAYIVYEMLRDQYRYDHIFHRDLTGFENRLAWKTGTSYGFRDALAAGVTKNYTIAVWVGRPDNLPTIEHYGAVTAAPLVFEISDYMEGTSRWGGGKIVRPSGVEDAEICWPSGLDIRQVASTDCHKSYKALTINGSTPSTLTETPGDTGQGYLVYWLENSTGKRVDRNCLGDGYYIEKSAHVWPRLTEPWVESPYRRNAVLPAWDSACRTNELHSGNLMITSLASHSTIKNPAGGNPSITLRVTGALGNVEWYCGGKLIGVTGPNSTMVFEVPDKGEQQLFAVDESNQSDMLIFYVD